MSINTQYFANTGLQPDATFDPSDLAGKSIVITGGASGLGEAFARAFVSHGAFVTIGDLSEERGKDIVSSLGGSDKAAFVPCDVLHWADQVTLFKTALAVSPSKTIDIVIANAGISGKDDVVNPTASLDDADEPVEPDLRTLQVNLLAVHYTTKLALHYFRRQPQGKGRDRCLVMTSSIAGYLDLPGVPQYCSSKWGVRGLMRALRRTMPAEGMRVNIIAPWFVRTNIISQQLQERLESQGIRYALAEDAAAAVLHIASDPSLNGRSLAIVTRDLDPRGYVDLNKDIDLENDMVTDMQTSTLRNRIGIK